METYPSPKFPAGSIKTTVEIVYNETGYNEQSRLDFGPRYIRFLLYVKNCV